MCPLCIGTAAWIAVSVVSTGGISALVVSKLRVNHNRQDLLKDQTGEKHGTPE
jgi:hypothetical protein